MKIRFLSFALLCIGVSASAIAMEQENALLLASQTANLSANARFSASAERTETATPATAITTQPISATALPEPAATTLTKLPSISVVPQLTALAKTKEDSATLSRVLRLLLGATVSPTMSSADRANLIGKIAELMPEIQKKTPHFAASLSDDAVLLDTREWLRKAVEARFFCAKP